MVPIGWTYGSWPKVLRGLRLSVCCGLDGLHCREDARSKHLDDDNVQVRWCLPFFLIPSFAWADVGEIALVEDTGGQIRREFLGSTYLQETACAFYTDHGDLYDVIFVFSSVPLGPLRRTASGWAVKSAARGIGQDSFPDSSSRYCTTRLRHAVKMGDIDSLSDDPDALYTAHPGFTMSGVQLMAHEFGHHWMASVSFDRGDGVRRCLLRGVDPNAEPSAAPDCDGYNFGDFSLHWASYFNTGSVMYGNIIEPQGGDQFLVSSPNTHGFAKYSELDQYLMGLRPKEQVSPMFLVAADQDSPTEFPLASGRTQTITGQRIDFTIDDVIRAEGERMPSTEFCHWKAAFVILHGEGDPPTSQQIARVDAYRRRFEQFYAQATDQRGSMDTTLSASGKGTSSCPAEPNISTDGGVFSDQSTMDIGPVDAGYWDLEVLDFSSERDLPETVNLSFDGGAEAGDVQVLMGKDCSCEGAPVYSNAARSYLLNFLLILGLRYRAEKLRGEE